MSSSVGLASLFFLAAFIVIVTVIARWVFRIHDTIKRVDKVIELLKAKKIQQTTQVT